MADIKSALRNIPEKQAGEEPANEGQKGYLRGFGYFSENLIKDLGLLQASYLVDQAELIKAEGSANIDISQQKTHKLGGIMRLIVLLAVLVVAVVMGRKFLDSGSDDATTHSEFQSEENIPGIPNQGGGQKANKKDGSTGVADPDAELRPESEEESLDLAVIQYPATVLTTKGFNLLNKEGKETPIAVGTTIKIADRSDLGTLTMEIDGELFVGNETRIDGKIELK